VRGFHAICIDGHKERHSLTEGENVRLAEVQRKAPLDTSNRGKSTVSNHRFDLGAPGSAKTGKDDAAQLRTALADRIKSNLASLLVKAEQLPLENRSHVLALAHALETFKTLSGEDVAAVIDQTQGSIIDGRPYASPDLMAQIEKYHDASLVAHREHRKPDVALPIINHY